MILRHFPGKNVGKGDFEGFHRENVVVYARSSDVEFKVHTAPLSIKTCLRGKETYELNNVPICVEAGKFLIVNKDQEYASYIFSLEETESFCVFFRDGIKKEVLSTLTTSHEGLLDNPFNPENNVSAFASTLLSKGTMVNEVTATLYKSIDAGYTDQLFLDECSNVIVEILLKENCERLKQLRELPFVKASTRIEIYRRLCIAKDYIESCYYEDINLQRLSELSTLSQHHFLRLFKIAFRSTPHQYLTKIRLEKSVALLKENTMNIADICVAVGFSSPSSFTRLFKSHFHKLPSDVRKK